MGIAAGACVVAGHTEQLPSEIGGVVNAVKRRADHRNLA
jgi:hypothetical protein